MAHRLATNYAKNHCNRTPIVKVIVENVVTCFFWGGTQCIFAKLMILFTNCNLWQQYSVDDSMMRYVRNMPKIKSSCHNWFYCFFSIFGFLRVK